ncbi:MAG TPA: hypothetical protein VL359_11005, partial [bacterium]|nr:hypothetical protein [bacterium]
MTQMQAGPARFLIVLVIIAGSAALAGPGFGLDRVSVAAPLVSSDQPALAGTVSDLIDQASALIARLYPGTMSLAEGAAGGTNYALRVTASQDGGSLALVLALDRTSDKQQIATLVWSGLPTPDLPLWMARGVFLLWTNAQGAPAVPASDEPVFV